MAILTSPLHSGPAYPADIHLRSYRDESLAHSHDFLQLVLPLAGRLELEIDGRQGLADAATAALVEPGAAHATRATGSNRSLVLDLAPAMASAPLRDKLARHPFVPLSPAAAKLIDFMALLLQQERPGALAQLQHWVPMLLDTLARHQPRPSSRLHLLMARIEAEPGLPWSVAQMASTACISPSRLHEWFRQEAGVSPRVWLAEVRLGAACRLLRATALPLAEIALRCGYGDQSALTHAMRKWRNVTPSAYRRALS